MSNPIDFTKYPLPRRMRHHTNPSLYFSVDYLKYVPDDYPPIIDSINWKDHFANGLGPNILDIGCGRGKFLLDLSFENSNKNHLGIEIRAAVAAWLDNVIVSEALGNVSVLRYSVANSLNFIADSSVEKIFYLFPDPWQKLKHIKRRCFDENFVKDAYRMLRNDGNLYIATDVEEIHDYHIDVISKTNLFSYKIVENDDDWSFPITNKEDFCRKKNIPFSRIICSKN